MGQPVVIVPPVPKVGQGAGGPPPGGLPESKQLCLNQFAGYVGAGPYCNKPPGNPCTRNHKFSPPISPAKWPAAILDAAEDAAHRVGRKNAPLRDAVLAAIVNLR